MKKINNLFSSPFYQDDCSTKWVRSVEKDRVYHFIEEIDVEYLNKEIPGPKYEFELSEVDLDAIPDRSIKQAINSCGEWKDMTQSKNMLAHVVFDYGYRALLYKTSTNVRRCGFRDCRKESYRLAKNIEAHEEAMRKPINEIGSTAREMMQGDLNSAINRGIREGKRNAQILAKVHKIPADIMLELEREGPINYDKIQFSFRPRDPELLRLSNGDSLAYLMGFIAAFCGRGIEGDRRKLAKAYFDGYKHGIDSRSGHVPLPSWLK